MAEIDDLLIRIDATTEQLRREMRRAEQVTDKSLGKIDKRLGRLDKRFVAIGRRAARAGTAMAAFAAAGGSAKLLQIAREADIFEAQLKTATGSIEGAAVAFEMLEEFAAKTPFALRESINAFITLKNRGLDPSRAALMSYANTASAMGKSMNQMIEAVADAATFQFERLLEFGIKASSEGDRVSFTFRGVTTTVKKNAEEIERFLRRLGEVEFAGAVEERVNSLDGALSNLGDTWDSLFRTIAAGPIGDAIEEHVRKSIRAIERLQRSVAHLQGTATPIQQIDAQLDELFVRRQTIERRLQNPSRNPMGRAFHDQLRAELETIKAQTEGLKEARQFFLGRGLPAGVEDPFQKPTPERSGQVSATDEFLGAIGGRPARTETGEDPFAEEFGEARRFFETTRTEVEQIEAQIQRVQELAAQGFFKAAGVDDQEVLQRLETQLQEVMNKTETASARMGEMLANNIGGAIDELFASGKLSVKSFAEAVLRDLLRIMVQVQVMKPLIEGLFGAGGGATGFGQALFSAFGFAKGGSFRVGGSGGPDSQFVPLKLTPGEQVTVTPAGQMGDSGGPIVIQQTLHVQGASRTEFIAAANALKEQTKGEMMDELRRAGRL